MNIQKDLVRINNNADTLATKADVRAGGGSTVTLEKGFMEDTMTISGARTIVPRYNLFDDFIGNNNASVGGAYFNEMVTGTAADAKIYGVPYAITGATGWGYAEIKTGTTTTGKAVLQANNLTNQNFIGKVDSNYYFRLSFRNVIFNDLSDGTDTYKAQIGFAVDNVVTNSVIVTYTDSENSGAFICTSHLANTPENTNTAVTVTADTEYDIDIELYDNVAKFWINGTLVATHSTSVPAHAANMTAPQVRMLKSAGTTDRQLYVDAIKLRIVSEDNL